MKSILFRLFHRRRKYRQFNVVQTRNNKNDLNVAIGRYYEW